MSNCENFENLPIDKALTESNKVNEVNEKDKIIKKLMIFFKKLYWTPIPIYANCKGIKHFLDEIESILLVCIYTCEWVEDAWGCPLGMEFMIKYGKLKKELKKLSENKLIYIYKRYKMLKSKTAVNIL